MYKVISVSLFLNAKSHRLDKGFFWNGRRSWELCLVQIRILCDALKKLFSLWSQYRFTREHHQPSCPPSVKILISVQFRNLITEIMQGYQKSFSYILYIACLWLMDDNFKMMPQYALPIFLKYAKLRMAQVYGYLHSFWVLAMWFGMILWILKCTWYWLLFIGKLVYYFPQNMLECQWDSLLIVKLRHSSAVKLRMRHRVAVARRGCAPPFAWLTPQDSRAITNQCF